MCVGRKYMKTYWEQPLAQSYAPAFLMTHEGVLGYIRNPLRVDECFALRFDQN